jgi:hypothetical protein
MKLGPILIGLCFAAACGGSGRHAIDGETDAAGDALIDAGAGDGAALDRAGTPVDGLGDVSANAAAEVGPSDLLAHDDSDSARTDLAGQPAPDLAAVTDLPGEDALVLPADGGMPADTSPSIDASSGTPLHVDTRLLAVSRSDIYELSRAGQVLQQRAIPDAKVATFFSVHGAAVTGRQSVHIEVSFLDATASAVVSGIMNLDLASGRYKIVSAEGLRTGGLVGAFGCATASGFVFVGTYGDSGLFRFDLAKGVYLRSVPGPDVNGYNVDVSRGRDGRIYALSSYLLLEAYDPATLARMGEVRLAYGPSGVPIRGAAVDADGKIFAAAERGQLLRYSATGQLEQSVEVPGVYWFHDVDIDAEGRLFFGGDRGQLLITDRAFATKELIQLPTTDNVEIVVVE